MSRALSRPAVVAALLAAALPAAAAQQRGSAAQGSPSVTPAAPAPPPEVPSSPPASPSVSASPGAPIPEPEPISFDEAVSRATLYATISVLAAEEIRRADGLLVQARSGSLPLLSATGTYSQLHVVHSGGGGAFAPKELENVTATLFVPVFAASRWYQWSHAADAVSVARAGEQDVRRTAAITAARAYLAVVGWKRVIDVSRRAVENARAHYDFARTRRAGGVGTALDEVRADQQLATSATQLEAALTALARSEEALGVVTGSDRPLDSAADPGLEAPRETAAEALRDADSLRADVKDFRERARAADRVARDSWADWLPTLIATGQPFYQHPATATTPEQGWIAQLVLSVPIFEGGLRVGQRRERDALSDEARTQLDGVLLQARSEVRSAIVSRDHAESALGQARRAADRAQTALRLVTEAYRAGATTSLDVTDAESRARDADTAAVVAEDAVRQARLDLLAATGHFP